MNTNQHDPSWLHNLREAEELLLRPIRACKLAHETPLREENGSMRLRLLEITELEEEWHYGQKTIAYVNECPDAVKHPGCPHFMEQFQKRIVPVLQRLGKSDAECITLENELLSCYENQKTHDRLVREARSIEEEIAGERNALEPVEQFEITCARIDTLKTLALEKVRAAISVSQA